MNTLKFKKGDEVKVISGAHKGKTATVTQAFPSKGLVTLEGIGIAKRKVKPSQINPKGGTKEIHVPIDASKVALVKDATKTAKPAKPARSSGQRTTANKKGEKK